MHEVQGTHPQRARRIDSSISTDAELVAGIGHGERRALAEVLRREGDRLVAVARAICGSERAEDVSQEVFVALWQRPDRFDPSRGSLRSFLLLQARSRATDVMRSEGSRAARERSSSTSDAVRQRGRFQVEDDVIGRIGAVAVQAALATIPEREREVIALAYFGGRTYNEVALLLGRPEGTVKSQVRTGLARLRTALDDLPSNAGPACDSDDRGGQRRQRATDG